MNDDLIKRLARWGEGASLSNHMLGVRSARQDCADAAAALSEAQATIARLEALLNNALDSNFASMVRVNKLEAALRSIGANTCCDGCQEAALVARAALSPKSPDTPSP